MTQSTNLKILVYGEGLAAYQTLVALTEQLASDIDIIFLKGTCQATSDLFYGNSTSPESYHFNLSSSVSEPDLLHKTNTSFSFGTYYQNWANSPFSWMQCFHLPLSVDGSVAFQHLITRSSRTTKLDPYLVSAVAAHNGKFAHPPADSPNNPLSRAEYGYQFSTKEWASLWRDKLDKKRVSVFDGDIDKIHIENSHIQYVKLQDGRELRANLYVDCSGPNARLLSKLDVLKNNTRQIEVLFGEYPSTPEIPPYRVVTSEHFGWQSNIYLQDRVERLTVFANSEKEQAIKKHGSNISQCISLSVGHRENAWHQNCVGIGQAASVIEPLTPAPMMMLNKDIQRLLELIPVTENMEIEQDEFNRRFHNDNSHVELFRGALLTRYDLPKGSYWHDSVNAFNFSSVNVEKLHRKISQFENRGVMASFDLEPFNEQEWVILHCGMGRKPKHYDRLADQFTSEEIKQNLHMRKDKISQLVDKMPPHKVYIEKLLQYFKSKYE